MPVAHSIQDNVSLAFRAKLTTRKEQEHGNWRKSEGTEITKGTEKYKGKREGPENPEDPESAEVAEKHKGKPEGYQEGQRQERRGQERRQIGSIFPPRCGM
jgi:hypothetical protein